MSFSEQIINRVEKVLLGKPEIVRLSVACFLAGGHVLVDDIPGVGKTTLALALAKTIGLRFQRIQFTSDLLPSDLLGVSVFNPKLQSFEFKPGPLFHHVILADEINRASPKTQSALLESMQEGQISIDGQTHDLPKPFFVIATQNPYEHHGTFPLPESQLDRFMMRLNLGYPSTQTELQILREDSIEGRADSFPALFDQKEVVKQIEMVRKVAVDKSLDQYIVDLAQGTRQSQLVELGLSPRGTLALRRAAQAIAVTYQRDYVIPDDIKMVAIPVMIHRIRLKNSFNGDSMKQTEAVVRAVLEQTAVPV